MLSVTAINDQPNIEKLIDCQRYSSLQKLLRITARVLEFIHILKVKTKQVGEDDDIHKAEPHSVLNCFGFRLPRSSFHKILTLTS